MPAEPSDLHLFGIRHHGPGCARSLLRAFDTLRPDCVLVEGPPESDELIRFIGLAGLTPPVALLGHCPDDTALAVYHPFAEFSPEWQALKWSVEQGVPARFIDLPLAHSLALEQQQRQARQAAQEAAAAQPPAADDIDFHDARPDEDSPDDVNPEVAGAHAAELAPEPPPDPRRLDPLNWLAQAAGHADGEAWWNQMVEERGDGEELFAAIAEAMQALRDDLAAEVEPDADEAAREAHMRRCIREARKQGYQRIAVVCGAWHVPALAAKVAVKEDTATLKDLPKLKVQSTWVPWTYRHLTRASGYGAGVRSPGWYEHLWRAAGKPRSVGWFARVATLLRERELDCSSAHLIEATRLADTLAALRQRPAPSLDELNEAVRTVLLMGDDAALRLIEDELEVGQRLGQVPPDVPAVPLQRDLEKQQKTLRLKPEATQRTLDLDLRQPGDLARSHLLHRLQLIGVPWGTLARLGRSTRGTFHEVWTLQWQPEFALSLIEASRWGQTLEAAAVSCATERALAATDLHTLAALVDQVLLAHLEAAVPAVTHALENRAALSGDALQLLAALPPLANVFRYGNVRQTDACLVADVLDGLIVRAAITLPLACQSIDDSAAHTLREKLLAAHAAVALRDREDIADAWQHALRLLDASTSAHELLQGLSTRLLLDGGQLDNNAASQRMSLHLSQGAEPARAADWLEGFLNGNAQVLLHDATVWGLVDAWLVGLGDDAFVRVLPLVRRSFAAFAHGERRDLGQRAARGRSSTAASQAVAAPAWDDTRAALPVPLLKQILGVNA